MAIIVINKFFRIQTHHLIQFWIHFFIAAVTDGSIALSGPSLTLL